MQAWPSFANALPAVGLADPGSPAALTAIALAAAAAALLLAAALHDIAARTVPNWMAASLLPFGLALRLIDATLPGGLLAAFLVLLATYACWRRGWMGGGDVKLLAAAALLVPPASALGFLAAVAISGSILALVYLAARRLVAPPGPRRPAGLLARTLRAERWRIRRRGPLPYACAIAAGFIFVTF